MENIDNELAMELNIVFDLVPRQTLKRHITKLFMHYIATMQVSELNPDTPVMAEDLKIFMEFLDLEVTDLKE